MRTIFDVLKGVKEDDRKIPLSEQLNVNGDWRNGIFFYTPEELIKISEDVMFEYYLIIPTDSTDIKHTWIGRRKK